MMVEPNNNVLAYAAYVCGKTLAAEEHEFGSMSDVIGMAYLKGAADALAIAGLTELGCEENPIGRFEDGFSKFTFRVQLLEIEADGGSR